VPGIADVDLSIYKLTIMTEIRKIKKITGISWLKQ